MPRNPSSRRRGDDLEKAVMAVVFAPVLAWIFVPSLRPVMLFGGGLLLVGGIAWITEHRRATQKQVGEIDEN